MAENLAGNIPHGGQMRWLQFASAQPDGWVIGHHSIAEDHPFLRNKILPRSALIEIIAQTAAAGSHSIASGIVAGPTISGMLIGLSNVRFYQDVRAGDKLELRVRVTHRMGSMFRCVGQAFEGSDLICEGGFSFFMQSAG